MHSIYSVSLLLSVISRQCLFLPDDEPDEEGSPQHYVLIHGILTAPVIQHLTEVGVNVDAIIRVKAQNYERFAPAVPKADVHSKDGDESVRVRATQTFVLVRNKICMHGDLCSLLNVCFETLPSNHSLHEIPV